MKEFGGFVQMNVSVKANWVDHFHGFVGATPTSTLQRPPDHGKGGAYLYVGSNLAQFGGW